MYDNNAISYNRMKTSEVSLKVDESMDAVSLIQRDMEATSFPVSVTADWLEEDGNETTWNQFQQPDWQV